jgi:hypothetical protein
MIGVKAYALRAISLINFPIIKKGIFYGLQNDLDRRAERYSERLAR